MQKITRKKSLVPAALVAAVSAVALSASPASAATININVGSAAIPSGARCVYVTGVTDGGSSGSVQFAAGGSAIINSIDINPGERVHFDWRAANCAGSSIREDFHTAPRPLPSVWNING